MNIAVIGGDFRSLMLSSKLNSQGHSVTLFSSDKDLGGFARGVSVDGFALDLGPQYLDNFSSANKSFLEMLSGTSLKDLGFAYSNFIGSVLSSEQMALPSWHYLFDSDEQLLIFSELIEANTTSYSGASDVDHPSLYHYFRKRFGNILSSHVDQLCVKFYGVTSSALDTLSRDVIPFACSRQALFPGPTSTYLKKTSRLLDDVLAAPKTTISEILFNLYPQNGYSHLFDVIHKKLSSAGVNIQTGVSVQALHKSDDSYSLSLDGGQELSHTCYNHVIFGLDERISEKVIFGSNNLENKTYYVPQYFIYLSSPYDLMGNINYIFDYDCSHYSTRFTNLSKYQGLIGDRFFYCVECTLPPNSSTDVESTTFKNSIVSEFISVVSKPSSLPSDSDVAFVHSVFAPKTYRLPLVGYYKIHQRFMDQVASNYPNVHVLPWKHTRKAMLDSIESFQL